MDPNVQVALVSVLATFITTLGVISVAVINNRKERAKAADAGVEAGLDERDVLERMLSLISENERKEHALTQARAQIAALEEVVRTLKSQLERLRFDKDLDGGSDV